MEWNIFWSIKEGENSQIRKLANLRKFPLLDTEFKGGLKTHTLFKKGYTFLNNSSLGRVKRSNIILRLGFRAKSVNLGKKVGPS